MNNFCYEYPRPAYSVDAVVISKEDNKVLLIKRKYDPFAGKWAFPGGFMDMDETPENAVIRELKEETGLSNISLHQFKTYGTIGRDPRGRIISTIFVGYVNHSTNHQVLGMDDAAEAKWFSLDRIPNLAFDHSYIIKEIMQTLK